MFRLFALVALVSVASSNSNVCITAYPSGCSGSSETECGDASCIDLENGSSARIVCSSQDSSASWDFSLYSSSSSCSGSAITLSGSGDGCLGANGVGFAIDCGGCFSGNSKVQLVDGSTTSLSDVHVGDQVLSADASGELFFDTVFRVPHWSAETDTTFVRLTTKSGNTLELTRGHQLHVGTCCSLDELTYAGNVKVGDVLFTVDDDDKMVEDVVVSREEVKRQGAYNVHTLNANLVVDGVVASHFTGATTWDSKSWAPAWYKVLHGVSAITGAEDVRSASTASSLRGDHAAHDGARKLPENAGLLDEVAAAVLFMTSSDSLN